MIFVLSVRTIEIYVGRLFVICDFKFVLSRIDKIYFFIPHSSQIFSTPKNGTEAFLGLFCSWINELPKEFSQEEVYREDKKQFFEQIMFFKKYWNFKKVKIFPLENYLFLRKKLSSRRGQLYPQPVGCVPWITWSTQKKL